MKDAKGHGSNSRGGRMLGRNEVMIDSQGRPTYSTIDSAAAAAGSHGIAAQHGIPTSHLGYNREAVNNAIASSNRAGRRIGGKEAKMIHALLKGRH